MISKRDIRRSLIAACIGSAGSSNISGENSRKNINWAYPGKILAQIFFCLMISFAHTKLTFKSYVNMTYSPNMYVFFLCKLVSGVIKKLFSA